MFNDLVEPQLRLYVISDSIGETAQSMVHATLTQFPDVSQIEIKKFPFIKSEEELINILKSAKARAAVVITTLVNPEFNMVGQQYAKEADIPYVDYMSDLIGII